MILHPTLNNNFFNKCYSEQTRIQNPVKQLRWSVLQKQLMIFGY